jgi:hypothetical protein
MGKQWRKQITFVTSYVLGKGRKTVYTGNRSVEKVLCYTFEPNQLIIFKN